MRVNRSCSVLARNTRGNGTVRSVREITVPLPPFAPRKLRGFRGAKGDNNFSNSTKRRHQLKSGRKRFRAPSVGVRRLDSALQRCSSVKTERSCANDLRINNGHSIDESDSPSDKHQMDLHPVLKMCSGYGGQFPFATASPKQWHSSPSLINRARPSRP